MKMQAGTDYKKMSITSASSAELVITLLDMLIDDLRRAIVATRKLEVERRAEELKHAFLVLQQLQLSVDPKADGDAGRTMERLYSLVRAKVLEAHIKGCWEMLQEQIDLLLPIRDAWKQAISVPGAALLKGPALLPHPEQDAAQHWVV